MSKMKKYNSNRICCVPQCTHRAVRGKVSVHSFPSDERLKKAWVIKLRIGKPVTKPMKVCSAHFKPEDFFWGTTAPEIWTPSRRMLKKNAVPSQCLPVRSHEEEDLMRKQSSVERASRALAREAAKLSTAKPASSSINSVPCPSPVMPLDELENRSINFEIPVLESSMAEGAVEPCAAELESISDHPRVQDEQTALEGLLRLSENEAISNDKAVQVCTDSLSTPKISLIDLMCSDSAVKAFTGVESIELLVCISECVAEIDTLKWERSVLERVIIVLVRLKTFLSFKCLATMFSVSDSTVHRYFYGTIGHMAAVLNAAIPWPSKAEVQKNEPKCFAAYRDVRIVLDCTEVEVEKSHCASCRILTYSHYKGVHTLKVLVGVSPAGLITFVSDCFGGRASDKACVEHSDVLSKLQPFEDDVMVDKGFNIDSKCTTMGIGVVQPPFLRKQTQFSAADAAKTVEIARARVHVERAIQRLKLFKILKGPLPWEMLAVADEVVTIIAGIVNLSAPILADKRFQ